MLVPAACGSADDNVAEAESSPVDTTTTEQSDTAEAVVADAEDPSENETDDNAEADPEPVTEVTPVFDFRAAEPIVSDFIDTAGLNGAALTIVHRDHGVIYENFWGVFDENRISLLASSSKMVVAGVLLHLQDQGLLDINAPVADVAEWGPATPTSRPPSCCRTAPA